MSIACPLIWVLLTVWVVQTAGLIWGGKSVPFTSDSADYIEQARALAQGEAPTRTTWGLEGALVGPSTSFPVGYALLAAPWIALGMPAAEAALAVSRGSMLLVPVVAAWAFAGLLGPWAVAVAVAFIGLMPGLLGSGELAMSDTPAMALSLAGIGLLLRSSRPAGWFFSGVLIAGAYGIRNAQLSLLLIAAAWVVYFTWRQPRADRPPAWAWIAGAALVVVPLLLRNLWVFGRLQPYDLPPSNVGLIFNVRTFAAAALQDMVGYVEVAHAVAWTPAGFVALVLCVAIIGVYASRAISRDPNSNARAAILLLSAAAVLGAVVVIAARTRYQWGGHISVRNTFPVVSLAIVTVLVLLRRYFDGPSRWRALGPAVLMAVLVTHTHTAVRSWGASTKQDALELQARSLTTVTFCGRPQPHDEVWISNWAFLARIDCAVPVRHLEMVNASRDSQARDQSSKGMHTQTLPQRLTHLPLKFPGKSLVVAVAPGTLGVAESDLPLSDEVVDSLRRQGWTVEKHGPSGLVLALTTR